MSKLLNLLFRWAAALLVVYWAVLFVGTHTPASQLPSEPPFPYADKAVHVGGYAVLAFVAAAAWTWRRTLYFRDYVLLLAGLSCYGVLDEVSQMLPIIRRNADVLDWAADTLGATIGMIAFAVAASFARRRGLRLARARDRQADVAATAAADEGCSADASALPAACADDRSPHSTALSK
jgi:VanZ family protein